MQGSDPSLLRLPALAGGFFTTSVTWTQKGLKKHGASLVVQLVENLPAMQETLVRFLGQEDPLEKG